MGALKATVWLHDPEGTLVSFGPDSRIPAEMAALIHPDAFADGVNDAYGTGSTDTEDEQDNTDGQEAPAPPAKSGPNAGAVKWAAYAAALDVKVPDGAKQGEIIAALEAAGKPTE